MGDGNILRVRQGFPKVKITGEISTDGVFFFSTDGEGCAAQSQAKDLHQLEQ